MTNPTEPVALEYRSPPRPLRRQRQPLPPEERRWRHCRIGYYLFLVVLFVSTAFYFGPHYWNFGKLTNVSPADFVSVVEHDGVPVVRAVKRYQRDNGKLPYFVSEIPSAYFEVGAERSGQIDQSELIIETRYHEEMVYNLTPGHEGWSVRGYFTNGAISIAPQVVDIPTSPATQP